MAQTKIQSTQLAESGVIPGAYTSADITIDSSGRITTASNGSPGGNPVEPDTQVVYGTGVGITSSSNLTFDSTTDTLSIGTTGSAQVTSQSGQPLILQSDAGTYTLGIGALGDLSVNGDPGTSGQVLTSAGANVPPVWATPVTTSTVYSVNLEETAALFNGSVNNFWATVTEVVTASYCHWDSYTGSIQFDEDGIYKISIIAVVKATDGVGFWPELVATYGSAVSTSLTATNTRHSTYVEPYPVNFQSIQDFSSAPPQDSAMWTDSYVFTALTGDFQAPGVYAASYLSQLVNATVSAFVTVEKLGT